MRLMSCAVLMGVCVGCSQVDTGEAFVSARYWKMVHAEVEKYLKEHRVLDESLIRKEAAPLDDLRSSDIRPDRAVVHVGAWTFYPEAKKLALVVDLGDELHDITIQFQHVSPHPVIKDIAIRKDLKAR